MMFRKSFLMFVLLSVLFLGAVGCNWNKDATKPTATLEITPSYGFTPTPTPAITASGTPSSSIFIEPGSVWNYEVPIYSVARQDNQICLTINCAWGADDIMQILDILDQYHVETTFFVLGKWAEDHPDEAKAIYARGHEIGNHSYNHVLPVTNEDTLRGKEAIEAVIGVSPALYRAPSGEYTKECIDYAYSLGMIPIQWSADTVDWKYTEEESLERLRKDAASGGIMLFHNDTDTILSLLPKVLSEFQGKGFKFVKLSELLYLDNYTVTTWGVQKILS